MYFVFYFFIDLYNYNYITGCGPKFNNVYYLIHYYIYILTHKYIIIISFKRAPLPSVKIIKPNLFSNSYLL